MNGVPLLEAKNITKSYAGVHALTNASFELRAGEVHALVGENGAGKSTLIKIITGVVQNDGGILALKGDQLAKNSPLTAKSLGIAAIYQQPALFAELTVMENIALGLEQRAPWCLVDWNRRRRTAVDLLSKVGARIDIEKYAGDLSMPEQQLVEIARALGANSTVLIMDEPTASLSEEETQNLFRVIRELKDRGVGIIYISHRLDELSTIADRVTVLRDGQTIATSEISQITKNDLVRQMVGRELSAVFPKRSVKPGETVLELRQLGCKQSGLQDVTLSIRAGEILGLAGLVGAGRTELARTLFGLTPADQGTILVKGKPTVIDSPSRALSLGIAYLPEDRRRHGLIMEMPVSANTTLAALSRLARAGFLDFGKERTIAAEYAERLDVKTRSLAAPVSTLSGGNQQKVAISRWLATRPSVLILDEPTQGVDVGAKSEIHRLMVDLAEEGLAILMISSELPEVLGMSDRIAVMQGGRLVGIVEAAEATQASILDMALEARI